MIHWRNYAAWIERRNQRRDPNPVLAAITGGLSGMTALFSIGGAVLLATGHTAGSLPWWIAAATATIAGLTVPVALWRLRQDRGKLDSWV